MLLDSDIRDIAHQVIEQVQVGSFATVDDEQKPHLRYMAAVPLDENLHFLYSLSAQATGKIEQLQHHPDVSWTFASANYHEVVTLHGRATIDSTQDMPEWIYDRLIGFANDYVINVLTEPHYNYNAIITRIDTVQLLAPHRGVITPQTITIH